VDICGIFHINFAELFKNKPFSQIFVINLAIELHIMVVLEKNLTVFEKSELALFARAENQHNKKLKRRKEKKLSKYRDFSKNLEKKHVYQQIRRTNYQ